MLAGTPDGTDWERTLLTNDGIPEDVADTILDAYDRGLEAVDDAVQDPDSLLALDGIGPSTVDDLAAISPLTPPGEWTTEKVAPGHYIFTAGDADIWLTTSGDRADLAIHYDGDDPLNLPAGIGVDNIEDTWTTAWWTARRLMETNPQGPDSDIPRNVPTPDAWGLRTNQWTIGHNKAGWHHTDTGARVIVVQQAARVDGQADPSDEHRLVIADNHHTHTSEHTTLATGTWAEMLDAAGQAMAAAPDGNLDGDILAAEVPA